MLVNNKIYYDNDMFSQINNNMNQSKDRIKQIKREIKDIFLYQKLIKKNNLFEKKEFFELELTILKDYIQTEQDISLLIIIPYDYPKSEPEIYCLTEFCHPHICDGRNLLFDIIKNQWQKNVHNLDFIINKLPGFFVSFLEARKKKGNYIVGNFILNKYYSINRLKELPIFCHSITYKEKKMTLYSVKSHKIITISEISFCMYELDNYHTGFCRLIFFADLKDLIGIQLDTRNNEIEIKWKNNLDDKRNTKIELISSNCENINKILLENQKKFLSYDNAHKSYNNNIYNNNLINNQRELTEEEKKIIMIEKQILYVEKSLTVGDKPNKGQLKYLLNLYQSAIEYYTSKDNKEKCEEFKTRMAMFEPELNKIKNEKNKKNNILIEDEKNENEKINIENISNNNNLINNFDFGTEATKKEDIKINNNIILNNDIFNFNNIQNNQNNNSNDYNINNIFNFIQPAPQQNNNSNNNNNLLDFGFDFSNLKNNMKTKTETQKNTNDNAQVIFDFFQNQEKNNELDKNKNNQINESNANINKNINNNINNLNTFNSNKEINNNKIYTQKTSEEIKKNNFNFNAVYNKENKSDKFANLLNDFDFFKANKENKNETKLNNKPSNIQPNINIEKKVSTNIQLEKNNNKDNQVKNNKNIINKNNIITKNVNSGNVEIIKPVINIHQKIDYNINIKPEFNNNFNEKNKNIDINTQKSNQMIKENIKKDNNIKPKVNIKFLNYRNFLNKINFKKKLK